MPVQMPPAQLHNACLDTLRQLTAVVQQLTSDTYGQPLSILSGKSIGNHVRHVLEFYELLVASAPHGQLNYDQRPRDYRLDTDPAEALRRINLLERIIPSLNLPQPLQLVADLPGNTVNVPSSVARELLYNGEHAIHHMALIQIALRVAFPFVDVPGTFGVAYSTVRYEAERNQPLLA